MSAQVREELLQYSDRRTTIDDDVYVSCAVDFMLKVVCSCCYVCHKPLRLKAFATYPNGSMHAYGVHSNVSVASAFTS